MFAISAAEIPAPRGVIDGAARLRLSLFDVGPLVGVRAATPLTPSDLFTIQAAIAALGVSLASAEESIASMQAALVAALAGQGLTLAAGESPIPDFYPGDEVALFTVSLPGLPAPASSVTLGVKVLEGTSSTVFTVSVTTSASAEGQITNTGVVQPDGTYTATAQLALLSAKTALLAPGQTYWAYLQTLPGPETVASFAFTPRSGGALG